MSTIKYSPQELSEALGEKFPPTEQQAEIIAAPLEPMLVIAGAGSGKTKTMADKVVWLVANQQVRPEQILGVTFTRKAAGELSIRIRAKIAQLAATGLLSEEETRDFLDPAVSTYHSYANTLVQDHGLRLGLEEDSALLGAAQSWQLGHSVLEKYTGDYQHLNSASSTLIDAIVSFSSEASEHLVTAPEAHQWIDALVAKLQTLPMDAEKDKAPTQAALKLIDKLASRATIAELAEEYTREKKRLGVMDYGDLVAHAARIAQEVPAAALAERANHQVVLLDEFQDTSHAQMVLFSQLYGQGHPVTAVGDPNQSIYGFRGASAGQLFRFPETFPIVRGEQREIAHVKHLTIAWRNTVNVLSAANNITAQAATSTGPVTVKPLEPSAFAQPGRVVLNRCTTVRQEAEAIADLIVTEHQKSPEAGLTSAVLSRNRSQLSIMGEVLSERGIRYQLVGLSGLLSTPEVTDLVACLHVLVDPLRSDKLMRLLAGARWRIGAADLTAFADWSRQLERRRSRGLRAEDSERHEGPDTEAIELARAELNDAASLIEALDYLPPENWSSSEGRSLSEEGRTRLTALKDELATLRLMANDDLETLIREVERAMNLDIEVAVRPWVQNDASRANLDAFADVVREYCRNAPRVELAGFLMWLEQAAEKEKGLPLPSEDADPQAVQLLTVHASKGLEWDIVAVMSLNDGVFPGSQSDRWTSGDKALPWPLRGDANDLPQWDTDQPALKELLEAESLFKDHVEDHHVAEERRLAYVAVTRAKSLLICSSSIWTATRSKPTEVSEFFNALVPLSQGPAPQAEIGVWVADEDAPEQNPSRLTPLEALWPYDPLDGPQITGGANRQEFAYSRRSVIQEIADDVLNADANYQPVTPEGQQWAEEAQKLLAQRDFLSNRERAVEAPEHVRASLFVELAEDPVSVLENLRRPVPRRPGLAARRGTAFHAWIEEFYEKTSMLDLGDLVEPADSYLDEALDLESMKEAFLASEWAQLQPAYVEVPLETRVGPVAVRGRIDAVFQMEDGTWLLLDWKTGRVPHGKDLKSKLVQLAVYRLGWSRLHGIPLEEIKAAFYYVSAGVTIRAEHLSNEAALEAMISSAFEQLDS
ncbi:ATP-dependent helicase [Arthrobacter sp. NIO-1057]|uniref:ATP-dependent helicase n=1 Tax=Arthrobacter sp. NIO-1057 TaxID=993071 RepID=UPI00071E29C8|nr:ATP-dependent DNA helicase [Arthrobacter sp. NIO-1057]KSU67044.1 DNA helicase UvrD [Arthrobacter sp. NIO-1057]SCB95362.1 DNA helicase-2 / ATP-dependent DNA helicase PcrA [Arthrobacter sp. NIO-1057]